MYKIAHFPKNNDWSIIKVEWGNVKRLEYGNTRWTEKSRRKVYITESDAVWDLVTLRIKWELKVEVPEVPQIKQSWDELSSD